MNKKYSAFITVLFCLFIFGFGIAQLIIPDRTFSEQENRYLAQFKAPTLSTLKSGAFMESFEDYITDQFPLRDGWIQLKAWCEKTMGKQENNNVYLGTDGATLFAQYTRPSAAELAKRVAYVNKLADNVDVPVYFALIPDKSYVWADRLPANAPLVDDGSVLEEAAGLVSDDVNWIDLSDALSGDDTFYRTDHHWTTMGAYRGYIALMTAMNHPDPQLDSEPELVADDFYGTTWSSSGAGWIAPDEIHTMVAGNMFDVTWYHNGTAEPGKLYDKSYLEKKDKYSMFLGGNQPLCVIRNSGSNGGKLLVIRDSYADSLAPFLGMMYSEVHLWDLRYNRTSLQSYIEENGIDEVLVLYSNSNFATDGNLSLLGM